MSVLWSSVTIGPVLAFEWSKTPEGPRRTMLVWKGPLLNQRVKWALRWHSWLVRR